MSDVTELEIILGCPLQTALAGNARYHIQKVEAAHLNGCDLDFALAVSILTEGTLYLFFHADGRNYSVKYQAPNKDKELWSPTRNRELQLSLLGGDTIPSHLAMSNLRSIVEKELGNSVSVPRIKVSNH